MKRMIAILTLCLLTACASYHEHRRDPEKIAKKPMQTNRI